MFLYVPQWGLVASSATLNVEANMKYQFQEVLGPSSACLSLSFVRFCDNKNENQKGLGQSKVYTLPPTINIGPLSVTEEEEEENYS